MFKGDKYDKNDVIISIGAFWYETLAEWRAHAPCLMVDYEATPEIYEKKKTLLALNGRAPGRLELHNAAVTDRAGTTMLYYYRGGWNGNTVSTRWARHVIADEYFDRQVEIRTVAMSDVLSHFARVRELWLNCEGSEIPIIMGTPPELFSRCDYISCEFHRFSSFLNITNGDVIKCVRRLEPYFEVSLGEDYHPYYEFFRRMA